MAVEQEIPAATRGEPQEVVVGGHRLVLKRLDKVLYPETGTTKAEALHYYASIADAILPHIRERAVTLKRWPDGVEGESFFEKSCPTYRPSWMTTAPRYTASRDKTTEYCVVNNAATLVWLANIAAIEFHVPLATRRSMERPKTMVFDLDPGPGTTIIDCCEVGLRIREYLEKDGLRCFAKTSGSKGLQLYVPLNRPRVTFDQTKAYARALAEELSAQTPQLVVANMKKSLRNGKVLIDWSQNDDNKTTICAYSLRGRARPTASTPLTWREVEDAAAGGEPEELAFLGTETLERVGVHGDLFGEVLALSQKLPKA